MKISDLVTNFKAWLALIAIVIALGVGVKGYADLPKKVEAAEKKASEAADKVQTLAASVDKYVAINEQRKEEQDKRDQLMKEEQEKREQLMLDLIKATRSTQ